MTENKVKFGLANVHVSKVSRDESGNVSLGIPRRIPGAVNIKIDPQGDTTPFYADNTVYFNSNTNTGYSGELEMALIPEWFELEYLNYKKSNDGLIVETNSNVNSEFALLFEFEGDVKKIRHILYRCQATRPTIEGKTVEDKTDVQTSNLNFTASPLEVNGMNIVKAKASEDISKEKYDSWYTTAPTFPIFGETEVE